MRKPKITITQRYRGANGSTVSDQEARVYGPVLEHLCETHGAVTPETVVEQARLPESALHNWIGWGGWDAAKAAGHYWIGQAAHLLRSIHVVVLRNGKEESVRGFFNVRNHQAALEGRGVYITVREAFSNEDAKKEVIYYALRELEGWRNRYSTYQELGGIIRAITHLLKKNGGGRSQKRRRRPGHRTTD
jgi:hypothetical protein